MIYVDDEVLEKIHDILEDYLLQKEVEILNKLRKGVQVSEKLWKSQNIMIGGYKVSVHEKEDRVDFYLFNALGYLKNPVFYRCSKEEANNIILFLQSLEIAIDELNKLKNKVDKGGDAH